MKKYEVTITETLKKTVEVEAESYDQAENIVNDAWYRGEHILDADCFNTVEFSAKEKEPEKIRVVLLEPNKLAREAYIGSTLEDLQQVVGGYIEAAYYFEEPVCIVLNDEGKLGGLPLNRGIYDKDKKLIDIIAGTAFICDCSGENFGSLSDEQIEKYKKEFKFPEKFFQLDGKIKGVAFNPKQKEKDLER